MRYSKKLIQKFQKEYRKKFNQNIKPEAADVELHRLARLVEIVAPSGSNTKEVNDNE